MSDNIGEKTDAASVADRILTNVGLVLTKTKDALVKDFIEHLDVYVPEFIEGEKYTYEDFKKNLKDGKSPFISFIESIFNKLGYDISHFENNKELVDLVKSILLTTINLGEAIEQLADGSQQWMDNFQDFVSKHEKGQVKEYEKAIRDLFDTDVDGGQSVVLGNEKASVKISLAGDLSPISKILNLIEELFTLIQKFKDIEVEKIAEDNVEFIAYIQDTYFTKQFAKRILDHILSVLLKNAEEIFSDDVHALIDHMSDIKKEVQDRIEGEMEVAFRDIQERMLYLQRRVEELQGEIDAAVGKVKQDVLSELKVVQEELDVLCSKVFKDYNNIAQIIHKVYVILDFLNIVKKESVDLTRFIPDHLVIPEVDEEKFNSSSLSELKAVAKEANKGVRDINKELQGLVQNVKTMIPVTEIYVIDWNAVSVMLCHPVDYFQNIYPMNDLEDAEYLISKILNVARAFNKNIPELQSLKAMLYDLLERIKNRIKSALKPLDDQARELFEKFEQFIIDVLKVLEKFAIEIKKELEAGFQALEDGKDSVISKLKSGISETIAELKHHGEALMDFRLPGSSIEFFSLHGKEYDEVKDFLQKIFGEPFIQAFVKSAAGNEVMRQVAAEDWKELILKSIRDNYDDNILKGYHQVYCEIEDYINDLFDVNVWEGKFQALAEELKEEFEEQTKDIPDSYEEVKGFCKDSLLGLMNGDGFNNPFSDFDFNEYFKLLSTHIKGMIPASPEIFFIRFRNVTVNSVRMLMNTGEACLQTIDNKLKQVDSEQFVRKFAEDLFLNYWSELKKTVHKYLFQPVLAQFEYCVKQWVVNVLLNEICDKIKDGLDEVVLPEQYEDIFNNVDTAKEVARYAVDLVHGILMLTNEAKEIEDWQDGLRLAVKIYRTIPDGIKKYLRELVDLPEMNLDIHLPAYSLDMENKFLAVTLYEYQDKDTQKESAGTYSLKGYVSIKLVCFAADCQPKGEENYKPGVYLLPLIQGDFNSAFNIGKEHMIKLNASATLNSGIDAESVNDDKISSQLTENAIGFYLYLKEGDLFPSLQPIAGMEGFTAYLDFIFSRGQHGQKETKPLELIDCEYAELNIADYPQKVYVGYNQGFDVGYVGGIKNLELVLKFKELNDLLRQLLKEDIVVKLDRLDIGYSYKEGFVFDGDASLKIPLNTDLDLKSVKFSSMGLEFGKGSADNLFAKFLTSFAVDLKCIKISLPDIGIGFDWNFKGISTGNCDFRPIFKMPEGLGISLDMQCVTGSGLIKWNIDKGEYMGALELQVIKKFGVSAFMLVNTIMPDKSKGLALVAVLSTVFTPGVPLGFGFTLTGIGGSLGKDRMLNLDLLRSGVKDGSLMSALLIKDLDKNLDNVFENIVSYYPISKDTFFFGVMGQISWAGIFKVDAGLFVQIGNSFTIVIAGVMSLDVSDKLDKLLSVHVAVMGAFDPAKGISLDASLFDSKIVGIELFGDMAMRIYWGGQTKGFLFSAGGFHPQYTPEAGFNVGKMQRLGFKLDYQILRLSLETYLAVTSNSVQFGADARLQIGWEKFGLSGRLYFNTLFQFDPFRFMFDIGVSVAVKVGSATLFSIGLDFALEGPAKWHVKGHAIFWFLFIKIEPAFNLSWGKSQEEKDKVIVSVYPLLADTILEKNNWISLSTDYTERLVVIEKTPSKNLVMQPSDTLSFVQTAVPLSTDMDKYGEGVVGDAKNIKLENIYISGSPVHDYKVETADFAPSLVLNLSNDEKLKRNSYERMPAGFTLEADCEQINGAETLVDIEREFTSEEVDVSKWEALAGYASHNGKHELKPSLLIYRPAIKFAKENLYSEKLVSRPSHRRNMEGFKRYVKKIDSITNR